MGRFPRYLVAFFFLCTSCTASAYDFYYRALYTPAYLTAFDGGGSYGGCTWVDSSYVVAGTDSTNHWTRYNVTMTKVSGGCGAVQWGYAYTCMSGYHWNGLLSSSTSCVTTPPPTCTPPKVAKPDGSCGDPCGGDYRQTTGQSGLSGGLPQSSMCINYCSYALVGNGDSKQFANAVLGVGAYTWTAKYKGVGSTCTAVDSGIQDDTGPDMVQDPGTKNTSQWHAGDACGYVNGKKFCSPAVTSGKCAKSDSGEVMCNTPTGTALATPPAPDTGTAGTAAKPVATVTQNNTTTNIYNSSTAAGSTVGVGSGSVTVDGTSNGSSSTGGTASTVGTQSNPSVEDCSKSGTCTSASNGGNTASPTDAKDFGQSLSDFQSGVAASPVVSAFSSVASAIPTGGAAPSQSFSMLGQTFTFQVPPAVLSAVTDVLSYIMKAVWCLIAIRRFMSA